MTYPRAYDTLLQPFTVDYEYQFLKRHALTLPQQSQVLILQSPIQDSVFPDARLVGQSVGSTVPFGVCNTPRQCERFLDGRCDQYVYIGSSCAPLDERQRPLGPDYPRWLEECTALRTRLRARAVEEIAVPARKMAWNDYQDSSVWLGLYRLGDPALCASEQR